MVWAIVFFNQLKQLRQRKLLVNDMSKVTFVGSNTTQGSVNKHFTGALSSPKASHSFTHSHSSMLAQACETVAETTAVDSSKLIHRTLHITDDYNIRAAVLANSQQRVRAWLRESGQIFE